MMSTPLPRRVRRSGVLALTLAVAALAGCSSLGNVGSSMSTLGGLITPYKIDILQGNVVVREQVQALQTGMSREQVRGTRPDRTRLRPVRFGHGTEQFALDQLGETGNGSL